MKIWFWRGGRLVRPRAKRVAAPQFSQRAAVAVHSLTPCVPSSSVEIRTAQIKAAQWTLQLAPALSQFRRTVRTILPRIKLDWISRFFSRPMSAPVGNCRWFTHPPKLLRHPKARKYRFRFSVKSRCRNGRFWVVQRFSAEDHPSRGEISFSPTQPGR